MANDDRLNGDSPLTLAKRLGTEIAAHRGGEQPPQGEPTLSSVTTEDRSPGPAIVLRDGLLKAEERALRLAGDIEQARVDLRLAIDAAVNDADEATPPGRRLLGPRRLPAREADVDAPSPAAHPWSTARTRLVALALVLAAVGAAWKAGVLWVSTTENVVLDSGFEAPSARWYPAGLNTEVARVEGVGRDGSAALQIRTQGKNDGEGAGYLEAGSISQVSRYTFSVFAFSLNGADAYPEIRWKASDGSLLSASRGAPRPLTGSWKRLVVSGLAPEGAASALLVVGEDAGTRGAVGYLVDDAQFERSSTAGAYVKTDERTGIRPGHLSDLAALLMLIFAGVLAHSRLRFAVLVAIPLSLLFPPSITSLGSALPDITPTRALVITSLGVVLARRQLRLPSLVVLVPAAAYGIAVAIAFVAQPSIHAGGQGLAITLGAWAPALLILGVARRPSDVWLLIGALSAVAIAAAGTAITEAVSGEYVLEEVPGLVFRVLERSGTIRTQATFPHPIILGTFLALVAPLLVGLAVWRPRWSRIGALVGLGVIVVGLASTLSRGPWLATIVASTTFVVLCGLRRRWAYLAAGFAVLALAAALPVATTVRDAATGVVDRSDWQDRYIVDFRLQQARELTSYAKRNPWAGHLDSASRPSLEGVVEGREIDHGAQLDSVYGGQLVQTGALGLVAFLAMVVAIIGDVVRGTLRATRDVRILGSALVASLLGALTVGLFSNVLGFAQVGTAFWLIAGAGLCLRGLSDGSPVSPSHVDVGDE
jgi:hypothetical protein